MIDGKQAARVLAVALLAVLGLAGSYYTVQETEQVIITQFGKPNENPVTAAGLHFKLPFIQEVNVINKQILEWDGPQSEMPTRDKLYIAVDTFARWRITRPLEYFRRIRDERSAQSRLDDILGSETRNAIAKHDLIEVIRTTKEREPATDLAALGRRHQQYRSSASDQERAQRDRTGDPTRGHQQAIRIWHRVARICASSASTTTRASWRKSTSA